MPKKRQAWRKGSVFSIPLKDGDYCFGLVVKHEPSLMNSVAIVIFDSKGDKDFARWSDFDMEHVFSALYVTRDLLDSGRWEVIGHRDAGALISEGPYEHLRDQGFVGAKVRGSGLVEEFVNAFYGLAPWDDWYIPDYLDGFLLSPAMKPLSRLIYSGRHPIEH